MTYQRHLPKSSKKFEISEQIVQAKFVVLGAGSIGSTKILLRSKTEGLEVSGALGSRFTGNGDAVAFSYEGNEVANSVGMKSGIFFSYLSIVKI